MPVKFNNLWFRVILNFENLYSYNVSSTKSRRRKRRKARLALIFGKVNRAEVSIFPSTICLTTFSRFFLQLLQTEMAENYERVIVLRGGGRGGGSTILLGSRESEAGWIGRGLRIRTISPIRQFVKSGEM